MRLRIEGLGHYDIGVNGEVWSGLRKKFLKPSVNSVGYQMVYLTNTEGVGRWIMLSRVVAFTYLGDPPTPKHEVNHKDHNKQNNNWRNLEWVTHSENIRKSYTGGYRSAMDCGRKSGFKQSEETKIRIGETHFKPVLAYLDGVLIGEYPSVGSCIESVGICRKSFNRIVNGQKSKYTFIWK